MRTYFFLHVYKACLPVAFEAFSPLTHRPQVSISVRNKHGQLVQSTWRVESGQPLARWPWPGPCTLPSSSSGIGGFTAISYVPHQQKTSKIDKENNLTNTCKQPGPPSSLLFGHAKLIGEYMSRLPPSSYIQSALTQIKQDHSLPDVFYLDLWPFGPEFVVCTGPDAAAIPTTVNSLTQASVVTDYFADNVGVGFIEAATGSLWKELHQLIAPGLTPVATKSYHGVLVEEARILRDRLEKFARSGSDGQVIVLDDELGKFPFDVTCRIMFGERLNAQSQGDDCELYRDTKAIAHVVGLSNGTGLNLFAKWSVKGKIREVVGRVDREIEPRVRARFEELRGMKEKDLPTSRTLGSSVVDRMLVSQMQKGGSDELDAGFVKLVMDK